MNEALNQYIENIDEMARKLSASETRALLQKIGRQIRQNNKRRIQANIESSGMPMRPRSDADKSYLNGWRKLRNDEDLNIRQPFYYEGGHTKHRGRLRQMLSIKRPEHDAKYGFPYRQYGNGRARRAPYDADYVHGFALANGAIGRDGVSKFKRKYIYVQGGSRSVKSQLMFRKIHQYKFLKLKANSHEAAIGFLGGLTGYIANAHQYGEDSRPVRELLGFSDDDLQLIENMMKQHFQAA